MKYRCNTEIVLNKLNLEIKGNEKIGVVGEQDVGKVQYVFSFLES